MNEWMKTLKMCFIRWMKYRLKWKNATEHETKKKTQK